MSKKLFDILGLKKKHKNITMVIPSEIHAHYEQKDDETMPVLFVGFTNSADNKPIIIALDPNAASDLIEEMNNSPMRMFIKINREKMNMMYV